MSSDRRPNKIASILRLPLVSKNLAGTLRQPTYIAIAASLGLHGVVGVGFALVSPNGLGDSPLATRIVETNLVELTPEEISRLPVVSTLPVGRLPSANSNALSAGTLPSLSGLGSSSSENSGQGLPPGPPPPLGASEPTYGTGSFFSSGDGGYSGYSGYTYNSGSDYDAGNIDLLAATLGGYDSGHNNTPDTNNSESKGKKRNLQNQVDPKPLPDEENNEIAEGEEIDENPDSPNTTNSGEARYSVTGSIPPTVPLKTIQGQYLVAVQVDAQGNIVGWELRDDSNNPFLNDAIAPIFSQGIQDDRLNEGESLIFVVFDESSSISNAGGSEQRESFPLEEIEIAGEDSDSETIDNTEPPILAIDPIFYPAADLSLPLEELPDSATIEIVVTPEGGMEAQLVASTGDESLDVRVLDRALAWAIEQKLDLNTPDTHQVTIPLEFDVKLDDDIETAPETATPEVTEETIEDKPIPPQTPTLEPLEPEVAEPEVAEPEVLEPEVAEPEVLEPEVLEPEVPEPEVPEPEPPQEKIPPSSPTPTLREKRPPQAPSEPESSSEGLPELPTEEPTQYSPPEAPLPIEKEPLSNSSKATKIKP